MITVRKAMGLDTGSMAQLLNEIIAEGGTTAYTRPITAQDLAERMEAAGAVWHVALNEKEQVVGFQFIVPQSDLPPDAIEIATFVQIGQTGLGIGSKLFDATRKIAKAQGYRWINANIREDNEGGLIYYQSRGFADYGRIDGVTLSDGQVVNKILKRYDL